MVIEKNCGDGQFNYTKSIDFSNVLNKSNDEVGISGETDCSVSSNTGDVNITATGGDVIIDSGSNINVFSGGTLGTTISANYDCNVISNTGKVIITASNGEVDINANDDAINLNSGGDINLTADSNINITTPTGDVIIDSGSNIVKFNEGKDKTDAETQIGSGFNNLETFNMYTNLTSGEIVTTLEMDLQNLFTNPSTLVNPFTVDGTDYTTGGIICNEVATAEEYFYKITEAINGIVYKIELFCVEKPTFFEDQGGFEVEQGSFPNTWNIGILRSPSNTIVASTLNPSVTSNTQLIIPGSWLSVGTNFSTNYSPVAPTLGPQNIDTTVLTDNYLYLMYYSAGLTNLSGCDLKSGKLIVKLHGRKVF